ncbi:DUF7108 family protein [Salarchaeum japonicum]|uniref:RnhA operon protein n=1 Tax=Salarchaeum japonicum TaxID=555573 RepID=A0AAV3T278_9EURY|nr:rnhA operon protein [Salarchaeum japonicum]
MTELPEDAVDEAERLTRLARRVGDEEEAAAYRERRDALLAEHDYEARVREDDDGDTLVCYPAEWLADGTVRVERIEDTDRAAERSLTRGGEAEEWESVEEHNRALVERVREAHGDAEAANARAFADFMGNHYSRRMETATRAELREFREEYYPRNVWPTDEQEAALERSLRAVFEIAGEQYPS